MPTALRLAVTADLHWGVQPAGDTATRLLIDFLRARPPDVLVLAGDIGTRHHFEECLALFGGLPSRKALTPGNHDVWVQPDDPRGDSLALYEWVLPEICQRHDFAYLDQARLLLPDADLGIVGSINWYDYSWSLPRLQTALPDWRFHLAHKLFTRGRHNDANFVRWHYTDEEFTRHVVAKLREQLKQILTSVGRAIVVTHHPCCAALNFPETHPISVDRLIWEAFSGNDELERVLVEHQYRVPFAISGHTHRARENQLGVTRGYNIGGDYDFKRLLILEWPSGTVEAHEFRA